MKLNFLFLLLLISLGSCQNSSEKFEIKSFHDLPKEENALEQIPEKSENPGKFALSSEGIQVVNINTGSTTMLSFGMEMVDVSRIVGNVLDSQIPEPQINSECGAGPMTMLIWNNDLN